MLCVAKRAAMKRANLQADSLQTARREKVSIGEQRVAAVVSVALWEIATLSATCQGQAPLRLFVRESNQVSFNATAHKTVSHERSPARRRAQTFRRPAVRHALALTIRCA